LWLELAGSAQLKFLQAVDQVVAAGVLLRIASSAAEACGQSAGLGGIELGKGVAHEQDFGGGHGKRVGDEEIAGWILFGAAASIEPGAEQWAQITGVAVRVEQLLGRYGS